MSATPEAITAKLPDRAPCYACKHRDYAGPGESHSKCGHPSALITVAINSGPTFTGTMRPAAGGAERRPVVIFTDGTLTVIGSRHGFVHGWFLWPFNFDPTWVEHCTGLECGEARH